MINGFLYPRPQHFDDDIATVSQLGAVHLGDRGGSKRVCVKLRKALTQGFTKGLLNALYRLFRRERRDLILRGPARRQCRVAEGPVA